MFDPAFQKAFTEAINKENKVMFFIKFRKFFGVIYFCFCYRNKKLNHAVSANCSKLIRLLLLITKCRKLAFFTNFYVIKFA